MDLDGCVSMRFDEPPEREDEFRRGTGDRWTASVHLGFGLDVRIADWTVRSEVSFLRSERDDVLGWRARDGVLLGPGVMIPRDQDVVAVTVGLRVPMR